MRGGKAAPFFMYNDVYYWNYHHVRERQPMQHLLITKISNMGRLYVGECTCGRFYVESLGQDRGSVAELKTAFDNHLKVQL